MNGYFGHPWGGPIFWIFILIVLAVLIVVLLNRGRAKPERGELQETAMDILKKRYARGEISKDEFEQIKKEIER